MDCEHTLGRRLDKMPARDPVDGTFELTVRCNLHCKMCLFRHADSENETLRKGELTAAQWVDMARQAAEMGTGSLLLTGGEPMLRPDFCELYEGIYRQGFILTLYTNATLVTPRIMETLRRCPPHKIGVTVYGACAETYGKVCGDPSAYERMLAGVEQLRTLPSVIDYRSTIIKDNLADVDAIEALVTERFGAKHLTTTRMVNRAVRGACADVDSCRLEPQENVRLALRRSINTIKKYVGDSYDEKNLVIEHREPAPGEDSPLQPRLTLLGCDAGMRSYTITWDGRLLGCQMLDAFQTNALRDGLKNAWEQFPFTVKLPPLNSVCMACESLHRCSCCVATRYSESGCLNGVPEYACRDTAIVQKLSIKGGTNDGA